MHGEDCKIIVFTFFFYNVSGGHGEGWKKRIERIVKE
jgi:hypothetical protein